MESYHGLILTPRDAMILLEAARIGMIPKTTRRLSEFERSTLISNGAIFIWDEMESGMKRWTDGKSWSASRVSGSFLIYKEMENTKNFTFYNNQMQQQQNATTTTINNGNEESYRYKNNGLIKQSFSITLNNNLKLHLISYINHSYLKKNFTAAGIKSQQQQQEMNHHQQEILKRPTEDSAFKDLKFDPSLYPETILTYQDTVTDFQQVDSSLKNESASPTSSTISSSYSSYPPPYQSSYQQRVYQQQQQQQTPPQHHHHHQQQQQLLQNNYRIQSILTSENSAVSPRLPPLRNSSQLLPPVLQGENPQQQQSISLLYLQQQQKPIVNTNVPIHHKEDGLYLNLLDRRFSS